MTLVSGASSNQGQMAHRVAREHSMEEWFEASKSQWMAFNESEYMWTSANNKIYPEMDKEEIEVNEIWIQVKKSIS